MVSKKELLEKFIKESFITESNSFMDAIKSGNYKSVAKDPNKKEKESQSSVEDNDFTKDLKSGNYKSVAETEAPTKDRRGSSRLDGDDPSELTPDEMQRRSKLSPGDTGMSKNSGSVYDMRSGGTLDPKFMTMAGKLMLHPKVGEYLDKKFGPDKMNKMLRWAKAAHKRELKRGDFSYDFGNIVKARMDLFDEHLGQGIAENVLDTLWQIYQRNYKNLPK